MDVKDFRGLMEAYVEVHAPQEVDEATAMAKRGYDEAPIRQKIAKSTGGGQAADRATKLADKSTFGDAKKAKQRQDLARNQRGDFRKTTSSSPGLHGYAHKSDDPKVKAKQAARGAQRGVLTPAEKKQLNREEFELWVESLVEEGYDLSEYTWDEMYDIYEAEGSYGETPKAYSAASKTKMTAKRKPFLKAMQRRTNPANRTSAYSSPRKGMTSDDRERARAGSAHGVGTRADHDYPSEGPGGVTKSAKKLRKQKAMGEFAKEDLDIFDTILEFLYVEGYVETLEEAEWMMANVIDEEAISIILGEEQLQELSNRKLRAYIKKSDKSHKEINKKWDQGTATEKEKLKSIGHEIGQERAFKRLNKEAFECWLDEAMSNYEKNRKRAAQRAAARNAARDQGKTGAVPGVGYVTPRRERETWTDESGKTRHAKGL
jgi:hypothetical protein